MSRIIIAISREFGSNGTGVGRKLGTELGIPVYERTVISMAAEKSGLSADYINGLEETASRSFLFNLVTSSYSPTTMLPQYEIPVSYNAYAAQGEVIRELATKGSCIIIGRCAEYILRDDPDCVKIFLRADKEQRVKAVMDEYKLDEKAAEKKLASIDKGRANYYKTYTGENWGQLQNHDLCINTTKSGVDGAVEAIKALLKGMGKL